MLIKKKEALGEDLFDRIDKGWPMIIFNQLSY